MRRWLPILLFCLLCPAVSCFALALCDYRSPLTDLSDLVLGFSYQYFNDPFGVEDRDLNEGRLKIDYVRIYDTPQFGLDVSLSNDMSISVLSVSTYETVADGSYKRYFSPTTDYFAFAGGSARSSSSFESLGLYVNLGVGNGRFTDVTPLARATRIDDYLVEHGSLSDHLHPVDLQILADEIGSYATYESPAELLAEVQEIIEDSGRVKTGGLDALDISEITRLIEEDGFSRYCGWDAKIGLGYELLDASGGEKDLLVTGAFNYAFTTTPDIQFLVQGSFSGPPAILETNRIDATVAYDCLVSDLLSLSLAYGFSRETWARVPTDIHTVTVDFALRPLSTANVVLSLVFESRPYYTEWNVDIRLSVGMKLL